MISRPHTTRIATTDPWSDDSKLDPETARKVTRRWCADRALPLDFSANLEDLAALGVQLALSAWPRSMYFDISWQGPERVELVIAWAPSANGLDDGPPPIVGELFDDMTTDWWFNHSPQSAKLRLIVDTP